MQLLQPKENGYRRELEAMPLSHAARYVHRKAQYLLGQSTPSDRETNPRVL